MPTVIDFPQVHLNAPPATLTDAEQTVLAEIFGNPTVKKYLHTLIWNQIADHANIPLTTMAEDGLVMTAIKQGYIKGGLSMLYTLLSIDKPQPTSVQATQQGQQTQR